MSPRGCEEGGEHRFADVLLPHARGRDLWSWVYLFLGLPGSFFTRQLQYHRAASKTEQLAGAWAAWATEQLALTWAVSSSRTRQLAGSWAASKSEQLA